jgi:hypothetical protein
MTTPIYVTNPWSNVTVEVNGDDITDGRMDALANLMDDEIRERLHDEIAPCGNGEFFAAYAAADPAGASAIWFS